MISRLWYHSFWNIYDHLGALALVSVAHVLLASVAGLLGLVVGSGWGIGLYILAFALSSALVLAALLPFCAKAVRGEPARVRHLLQGLRQAWGRVLVMLVLITLAALICYFNLHIYFSMDLSEHSRGMELFVMVLAGLQGWILLIVLFGVWPLLCAGTAEVGRFRLGASVRRGLITATLTPGLWLMIFVTAVVLFVLGFWSTFGLVVYLPIMAMIAQTGYFLSMQYAGFLATARAEVEGDVSVAALKRRARELAMEWEYAEPRRTFKELIKPWEY